MAAAGTALTKETTLTPPAEPTKKAAWRVETANGSTIQTLLNNLDASGWHIFKIGCHPDTHVFWVVAQPKRGSVLSNVSKQLKALIELERRILALAERNVQPHEKQTLEEEEVFTGQAFSGDSGDDTALVPAQT